MSDAIAVLEVRVKGLDWKESQFFRGVYVAWCPLLQRRFYAERPEDRERWDEGRRLSILSQIEVVGVGVGGSTVRKTLTGDRT